MGVGVSGWPLANAVARLGQLGVVSGTSLAVVLARRLQKGDHGGHMRRALAHFPVPGVADRVLTRYFVDGGKPPDKPYKSVPVPSIEQGTPFVEVTVLANFAEVFLAKEGHDGAVGVNYLEKLQMPALPSIFGAMLASVDYVLMGAGIPRYIPHVLDLFAQGKPAELRIDVEDATDDEPAICRFDPAQFCGGSGPSLHRPQFLPIVSSTVLATTLARKTIGNVDGFVIEGATAGGHNAPPRGPMQLDPHGEPIYGPRDVPDLEKFRRLGLPFWMAGGFADPRELDRALNDGASGIQVGTAFAFCNESGIAPELKARVIELSRSGQAAVFTDPRASPTGFPFKVVSVPGSMSEADVYAARPRICDLGFLRRAYRRPDGTLGYRCPAEPVDDYLRKGGELADTVGRKCICNSLFSTVDMGQINVEGNTEPVIVTAGDDVANVARFLKPGEDSYTAADVIRYLLEPPNDVDQDGDKTA